MDGVEHTYIYAGGKLIRESYGPSDSRVVMDFVYDQNGYPYALYYNDTKYFYRTNLMGDVLEIIDGDGKIAASYNYDAWGKVLSAPTTGVGAANPLRYRGYYYDSETGFYYLQSRYYDPAICRFINADAFASTGQGMLGYNMFAYCNNSPVNFEDSSGCALKPCTTYITDGARAYLEPPEPEKDSTEEATFYPGTSSLGVSGSVGVGPWIWGAQGFITIDANSRMAVQYGFWGGMSGGANSDKFTLGFTPIIMVTNAQGYESLEGNGIQVGASFVVGSVDYVGLLDRSGQNILYHGVAVAYGATSPDFHVTWGNTQTWFATEFDWERYYWATQY